ncbi:MAG: nitroreductase family protein, partial [Rhodocyclaceae bacterium]|nr:nitroreductase family protein [Rhodocyclaceae bacterium]
MPLDDHALRQLFLEARTHNAWQDKPVPAPLLQRLYDLLKWG